MKQTLYGLVLFVFCISYVMAEPWPLAPTGDAHKIFTAYGQFAENTGGSGFHFHEGIDISAADGENVLAVNAGEIEEMTATASAEKYSQFITISLTTSPNIGWAFGHLRFSINPATGITWVVGDSVSVGDVIGAVDKLDAGSIFSHLHWEYVNDSDGGWSAAGTRPPALNGDPLEFASPATDTKKPAVTEIHYRDGDDEGVPNAKYHTTVVDSKKVLYGNIDIVVRAEEQFSTSFSVPLSIQSIEFKVDGPTNIVKQVLEEFTGTFINSPGSFGKFRNAGLAQVIYEHDDTVKSNQDLLTGATNKFYYILTNKDDDNDLELSDSDRYWNTDINDNPAFKWNAQDVTGVSANAAKHTLNSKFSDGVYKIDVVAKDEAGNTNIIFENEIILDNWHPHVKKVEIGSPVKYIAEWTSNGADDDLIFTTTKKEFLGVGEHPITIEFTEPVTESALPTLNIDSFTMAVMLSTTEAANKKKTWKGILTLTASDNTHDGEKVLTIEGKDLALNSLDGAPGSIALRDNAGVFQDADNGANKDTLHKIKIDTQPPVVTLNVRTTL